MSERKGGMILLGIIALAALGFSGYMFIDDQFLSDAPPPDNGLILVGLWEDLAKNKDYTPYTLDTSWLIEFSNNQYNDSNYISVSNDNTRFKLLKEGFYKITFLLYLYEIDPSGTYWVYLYRNNSVDQSIAKIALPTSTNYQVESSVFVKSTGLDNFFMRCYCTGDTSFTIATAQSFNQLSFEYNQ